MTPDCLVCGAPTLRSELNGAHTDWCEMVAARNRAETRRILDATNGNLGIPAPAKGGAASAAYDGNGTQLAPEAAAPSLGVAASAAAPSDLRASSSADPASHTKGARRSDSTPAMTTPGARTPGEVETTTA